MNKSDIHPMPQHFDYYINLVADMEGILQHIIDFERILSYRALLFARNEGSVPQPIEEKVLGAEQNVTASPLKEWLCAFLTQRQSFGAFIGLTATSLCWIRRKWVLSWTMSESLCEGCLPGGKYYRTISMG